MENVIYLDRKDTGSFLGEIASKYAYTPVLRKRLTELLGAAKRSENRYFVLEGDILRAAGHTLAHGLHYMREGRVLLIVKGCGRSIYVTGTNGGKMPCGANLTMFGQTAPYYCPQCECPQCEEVQSPSGENNGH